MRLMLHKFTRERFNDDDLHIHLVEPTAVRKNTVVRLSRHPKTLLVLFAANAGSIISEDDIFQALYRDRNDGGPEALKNTISQYVMQLRACGPALGFRIDSHSGRGYSLNVLAARERAE
jgi:DNA-binding response OmpR family regulator